MDMALSEHGRGMAWHGRGTAWARLGYGMLCVNRTLIDKAEIWSAMSVLYIKSTVLLTETMNSNIYIPFTLMHILGTPVLNFRSEPNYTSLPELTH